MIIIEMKLTLQKKVVTTKIFKSEKIKKMIIIVLKATPANI
jgi:hypothetical protein